MWLACVSPSHWCPRDICAEGLLVVGICLVRYRIFSSIHGLDPPDANSTPPTPLLTNKKYFQILSRIPRGQTCLQLSTIALRAIQEIWVTEVGKNGKHRTSGSVNKRLGLVLHSLSVGPHCSFVVANGCP